MANWKSTHHLSASKKWKVGHLDDNPIFVKRWTEQGSRKKISNPIKSNNLGRGRRTTVMLLLWRVRMKQNEYPLSNKKKYENKFWQKAFSNKSLLSFIFFKWILKFRFQFFFYFFINLLCCWWDRDVVSKVQWFF